MYRLVVVSFLITAVLAFVLSCKDSHTEQRFDFSLDPICGLASPIKISETCSIIHIEDYICNNQNFDSIKYSGGRFIYDSENSLIEITENFSRIPDLSKISFFSDNNEYIVVCIKEKSLIHSVEFAENEQHFDDVRIAGDFNAWNPDDEYKLSKNDNIWSIMLDLDIGVYQYQIVADGNWMNNPQLGDTVPNGIGGYNTLLKIQDNCQDEGLEIIHDKIYSNSISIKFSKTPEFVIILWQNQEIPLDLNNFYGSSYNIIIPDNAKETERSYLRVFASSQACIANDILIPLEYGEVISTTKKLNRFDKHNNIMYSLMVDRFANGDIMNDAPLSDKRVDDKANYMGGDLQGVFNKIHDDYFSNLNINMLWISPITQNPLEAFREYPAPHRYYSGYHGYWPISSTLIDTRFGSEETFKKLIAKAHKKEINIILDFVANHVHEDHPLYKENKSFATNLILEDGRKNIRIWDDERLTTWFDTFLPSWDFSNERVIDTISELAVYWIYKYNIDGFRHDATKHIPEKFWRTLTNKIKKSFPSKSVYQVGETFGSRKLIGNYVGSGMLDGQFDFNLYFDARNTFACSDMNMANLAISLMASLSAYGSNHLMSNITGNHDLVRFITYADGAILSGECDKEAGWNRDIKVLNEDSYDKLCNLAAFIMTIPGIPCIYYGDEIGMPGANDPDNRRMMRFNNLSATESKCLDTFKKLTNLRKSSIELIYGTTKILKSSKNLLIYKRKYFDNESIIILSNGIKLQTAEIEKDYFKFDMNNYSIINKSEISETNHSYLIQIPANSFEIITSKR